MGKYSLPKGLCKQRIVPFKWFIIYVRIIGSCLLVCLSLAGYTQNLTGSFKINGRLAVRGETIQVCVGAKLLFENADPIAERLFWRFKNGTPPTSASLSFVTVTFNNVGTDSAVQVAVRGNDTVVTFVLVKVNNTRPAAAYTFTPANECGNIPIQFDGTTSTGTGLTYRWNFGDGNSATTGQPSHQFLSAIGLSGTQPFPVQLIVTNNLQCSDTAVRIVTVKKIPDAKLGNPNTDIDTISYQGVTTFRKCINIPIHVFKFTNATTTQSINTKYTIQWGDNSPDSVFTSWPANVIISHPYTIGQHFLTLTVDGSTGCKGIKKYNIFLGTNPAGGFASPGNTNICSNNNLSFIISGYANNPPGTSYTIVTNDGTPVETFQHPPPDTVTHFFAVASCGFSSSNGFQNYLNAYSSTLIIQNPCDATSIGVIPIYVSGIPKANIFISPTPNICVNNTISFFNISSGGGVITTLGGGNSSCTLNSKQVWVISPSTGYNVTNGIQGNLNNSPLNTNSWVTGTNFLNVNFTTAGTYNVKMYVGNDRCGTDTISRIVCVRNPPKASFVLSKNTGCAPDSITINNTSPLAGCQGDTYSWDVTYSDALGCAGVGGTSFSYTQGANLNTKNPGLVFNKAGRYIIKLTVSSIGTGFTCANATFTDTFFARAKPRPVINPIGAVCIGNDITPTVTVNNCYNTTPASYLWVFTGGTPDTSLLQTPGSISYSAIGNFPVKLSVTNECGTATLTDTARITSTPTANAGAHKTTCSNQSIPLGSSPAAGIAYGWKPTTGLNNSIVANPLLTFAYNGPSADTVLTYVLTASAGPNCSSTDTVLITIKKNPSIAVTPQTVAVCAGSGTMLTASGSVSYTWLPAAGLNQTTGESVEAAPSSTTQYTVTGLGANGCTAQAATQVSVINFLNVQAGADTLACNTSTAVQLTGSPAGGVWSGSNFLSPAGAFNATVAGNGVYKLFYTAGNGGCLSSDSVLLTIINAPVANVGNDTVVCQSSTFFQLKAMPGGGRWTGSTQVSGSGLFNPATPGTYSLMYTIGGGTCIGRDTIIVTVSSGIANNLISGNQSICTGNQPSTINGQNISGGGGTPTYRWQQSTDSLLFTTITGANAASYQPLILTQTTWYRRLAATTVCGGPETNTSNLINITINQNAIAFFNPTNTVGCIPFAITPAIINLTPYNNLVKEYRWLVNGNYIGSGQNFPGYTMRNNADSITITLVAVSAFGCKNDTLSKGFTTLERPDPSFTQTGTIGCGPLNISFANTTPNAPRYTYLYNFGQGQTSTAVQPGSITFPINPNYGDTVYRISQTTFSACDTITNTSTVTVRAQPKALFTPNRTEGCSPMRVNFTNTSRGSNANYMWSFGDGTPSIPATTPGIQHTFTTGVKNTFYVKLTGTNDCGSDSLVYAIVVNPNSIRIDFALNGNERFGCAPHTVNFVNNTSGANTFMWNFGDGTTLSTLQGIDTVRHTYTTSGNFNVQLLAANGCNDTTDTEQITVQVQPVVAFTASPLQTCVSDTIRTTNTSDTNISYRWRFGDGTTASTRSPQKVYTQPGNYRISLVGSRVFAQGLSCSDSAFANIVIRDTIPGNFTVSDSIGNCIPFTVLFTNNNASNNNQWTFGDGTSGTGIATTHTYTRPGNYLVTQTSRSAEGCTYKAIKNISVTAPVGSLAYTGGYTCTGNSIRFEVKATNTTNYTFVFGNGDSLTTTNAVVTHQYNQPGSYVPYAWLNTGTCRQKVFTGDTIKVDRIKAGYTYNQQYSCGNTGTRFADTSYSFFGIRTWQWNFGDATISSAQNPVKNYTQNALNFVQLQVIGNSGCTATVTLPIQTFVRNYPQVTIGADSTGCTGQPVTMRALVVSADSVSTNNWLFGNNTSAGGLNVKPVYNSAGMYTVRLIASTIFGCSDTASKTIGINASPVVNAGPNTLICLGQQARLQATGTSSYEWLPTNFLSCTNCANPVATATISTAYVVRGTNAQGCTSADTMLVEVIQPIKVTVSPADTICIGDRTQLFANGGTRFLWNPANGLSSATEPNPIATPVKTTPYRVITGDRYNCFADTGYVTVVVGLYPTVRLGTGTLVVAGTDIRFNPTFTNGPFKNYLWTPNVGLTCSNCPNPVATINNNITYRLTAQNIYGCSAGDTISYTVQCQEAQQVFVPNAFSPDGDNVNDVLMVRGRGIATVKYFRIFNRWGELVFERNNFNPNDPLQGWDGRIRGQAGNPDVYVYTAEVICSAGGVFVKKGNVTLFR